MRIALLPLLSLALAALAPAASAQAPTNAPSMIALQIAPFGEALAHGTAAAVPVEIDYCYFVLGAAALTPTKATLRIVEAPAWLVVHVSPSTIYFPIGLPAGPSAQTCAPSQTATLTVTASEDAPAGAVGTVRLQVDAAMNQPIAPASGDDSALVQVTREPCHDAAAAAASDAALPELEEKRAGDVGTQSAGVAPVSVTALPAVLGLLGAVGAGAWAWTRRR